MSRKTNELDAHIGAKLRSERTIRNLSQEDIASHLEITFQQIQKYEKATNRISASRLYDVAHILNVPITFFYEGFESKNQVKEKGEPVKKYKESVASENTRNTRLTKFENLYKSVSAMRNPELLDEIIEFISAKIKS